jgi:hypothetical protein
MLSNACFDLVLQLLAKNTNKHAKYLSTLEKKRFVNTTN